MKKFKSMKKRDEKMESLLMEKWGYGKKDEAIEEEKQDKPAPGSKEQIAATRAHVAGKKGLAKGKAIKHAEDKGLVYQTDQEYLQGDTASGTQRATGLEEDGDKELLQEEAISIGTYLIITAVVAVVSGAIGHYYSKKTEKAGAAARDFIIKDNPETQMADLPEAVQSKVLNFKQEAYESCAGGCTWEQTILGAESTKEDHDALERYLRHEMGNDEFEREIYEFDQHLQQAPYVYLNLKQRGIPLQIDIDEHQRLADLGQSASYGFTDDQIERQKERVAAFTSPRAQDPAGSTSSEPAPVESTPEEPAPEEPAPAESTPEEQTPPPPKEDPDPAELEFKSPFGESVSKKTTKDIVREEIVRYLSNRREK